MHRASDAFLLNRTAGNQDTFKIQILAMEMQIRRIHISNKLAAKIPPVTRFLSHRTELKTFPLASGLTRTITKIFSGDVLPKHIIIGQVKTNAFAGDFDENPFYFGNNNLTAINLRVNGKSVPSVPLRPEWDTNLFIKTYWHTLENAGIKKMNDYSLITPLTFKDGHTLFCFDLTPDNCNMKHLHAPKGGQIDLELEWEPPGTDNITVLVQGTYNQLLENDETHKNGFSSVAL